MVDHQSEMDRFFRESVENSRILFAELIRDGELLAKVYEPGIDVKTRTRLSKRREIVSQIADMVGEDAHIHLDYHERSVWDEVIYPLGENTTLYIAYLKSDLTEDYIRQRAETLKFMLGEKGKPEKN